MVSCLTIAGCQAKITPADAGTLFVNRLIYQAEDERFNTYFDEGEALGAQLKKERTTLVENLVASFNDFGSVLSPEQTKTFMELWLAQVDEKTGFEVVETGKDGAVEVKIAGLDFPKVYRATMDQLVAKMLADPDLAKNNAKLGDLLIQLLTDNMADAEVVKRPLTVQLSLEKSKGKWKNSPKQQKAEIAKLTLAFLVGANDLEEYGQLINEAVNGAMDAARNQGKEDTKAKTQKADEAKKEQQKKPTAKDKLKKDEPAEVTVETMETYAETK